MDWPDYFYGAFPAALGAYAASARPDHACPHCRAPVGRRAWLPKASSAPPEFRCAWYGLTLIDQALFEHFGAEANARWLSATGGYPLPVVASGFGCVRVAPPALLLAPEIDAALWGAFVDFYLAETAARLEPASAVSPAALFGRIAADPGFNRPPSPHETLLLERARRAFATPA